MPKKNKMSKICKTCVNECKQPATIRVLKCPAYEKKSEKQNNKR